MHNANAVSLCHWSAVMCSSPAVAACRGSSPRMPSRPAHSTRASRPWCCLGRCVFFTDTAQKFKIQGASHLAEMTPSQPYIKADPSDPSLFVMPAEDLRKSVQTVCQCPCSCMHLTHHSDRPREGLGDGSHPAVCNQDNWLAEHAAEAQGALEAVAHCLVLPIRHIDLISLSKHVCSSWSAVRTPASLRR